LLAHESGIYDYWNDQPSLIDSIWSDTSRFWTDEEIIASIGPPHFAPGDGYRYSNTNYVLAGMIMKVATGKTWAENVHEHIIDTLDLESTFIGAVDPRNGPVAAEWDYFSGNLITNSPMTAEYSQANACGAVLSTAEDMALWYKALFEGSVISDASMQEMLSWEPASLFGLGIIAGGEDVQYYHHTGGMLGYISIALYDIRREAIIVILFNDRESNFSYKWNNLLSVFFNEYPDRDNDAGIVNIISPWEHFCDSTITPLVVLRNFGSDVLNAVTLKYQIDSSDAIEYQWSGTLDTDDTTMVVLPSINGPEGSHSFTCYTTLPNGEPEGYNFNDTLRSNFFVNIATPLQSGLFEGFDGDGFPKEGWTTNSSAFQQWNETYLARHSGSGSAVKNNSDMSGNIGTYADLQLPLLNITNLQNSEFSFDYSYAPYPGYYDDSLQVSISEDCGESWHTLFYSGGLSLRTTTMIYNVFFPQSEDDWEHLSFSLSEFQGDVLIRFRAHYGGSNNLFVDNILIGSPAGMDQNTNSARGEIPILIYPNPFTTSTTLSYTLDEPENMRFTVYDVQSRIVFEMQEKQKAGEQQVQWNAEGLPAGMYYFRIQAGDMVGGGKMVKME
jgi:CubicO group peptidase (beta-lactamase class C family)